MNILVTGASGFIAAQIITDLISDGHEVTCCARDLRYTSSLFPNMPVIKCDFINDTSSDIWINRLKNIDVVINCVGILYHPNKKIIWAIHYATPRALFDACVEVGVKKIIQISALGVDQSEVEYSKSKKAADDYLLSLPIKSRILRPSFVYGRGSYGGSSLFRGLAGLPFITPVPGNGAQTFQPIYLQDLAKSIIKLVNKSFEGGEILTAVGPKKISLSEILIKTRSWLGFAKTKLLFIPLMFIKIAAFFGDFIPYSALNNSSYKMLMQNNITTEENANNFYQEVEFIPRDFITGINSQPSTVQDHWHAKLFFLKPILQVSIAFVWIFTAICSLFIYPKINSYHLLSQAGVSLFWQPILLYGASLLDALIGFAVLIKFKIKLISILQISVIVFYSLIIACKIPSLLIDPFLPIGKNIPFIVAILIFLALESDR